MSWFCGWLGRFAGGEPIHWRHTARPPSPSSLRLRRASIETVESSPRLYTVTEEGRKVDSVIMLSRKVKRKKNGLIERKTEKKSRSIFLQRWQRDRSLMQASSEDRSYHNVEFSLTLFQVELSPSTQIIFLSFSSFFRWCKTFPAAAGCKWDGVSCRRTTNIRWRRNGFGLSYRTNGRRMEG